MLQLLYEQNTCSPVKILNHILEHCYQEAIMTFEVWRHSNDVVGGSWRVQVDQHTINIRPYDTRISLVRSREKCNVTELRGNGNIGIGIAGNLLSATVPRVTCHVSTQPYAVVRWWEHTAPVWRQDTHNQWANNIPMCLSTVDVNLHILWQPTSSCWHLHVLHVTWCNLYASRQWVKWTSMV